MLEIFKKSQKEATATETAPEPTIEALDPYFGIPVPQESWNITILWQVGLTSAINHSNTYTAKDEESCISDALSFMRRNYGESPRSYKILDSHRVA